MEWYSPTVLAREANVLKLLNLFILSLKEVPLKCWRRLAYPDVLTRIDDHSLRIVCAEAHRVGGSGPNIHGWRRWIATRSVG